MEKEFIQSNIVMLGDFNPANYDKLFFIKNDLISEEEFLESSIFTPKFSRINTKDLVIDIELNKVLIFNSTDVENELLKNIAEKIVDTPAKVNVIGFNFKWFLLIDNIYNFTKKQFYLQDNNILNKHFNSEDTAYGYYISDDFLNSHLKLEIKPSILQEVSTNKSQNILSFDFNFHIEKVQDNTIENSLDNYTSYLNKAQQIILDYE